MFIVELTSNLKEFKLYSIDIIQHTSVQHQQWARRQDVVAERA